MHGLISLPTGFLAACIKNLSFYAEDRMVPLIEWLEVMWAQGHEKIFFYQEALPPMMEKVVRYYEKLGFVELIQYQNPSVLPTGHPAWIYLNDVLRQMFAVRAQTVPRNDCLMR